MLVQQLTRRIVPCLALVALAGLAHAADLSALHAALFKRALADPTTAFASPSDGVSFFLSGWMLTGDDACRKAAQEQLTRSHAHINRDGLYEAPGAGGRTVVSTRATVDHLLAYLTASQLLEDHELRVHLDRCADGMMQSLARYPALAPNGETYMLFEAEYEARKPYKPVALASVSPDRSAAVGLVFTLLYFDERSKWFHDGTVKDIALNELHASMATQRLGSGAIVSNELTPRADPAVGAAVLFAWSWANRFWQEPDTETRIRRAVDWLDPLFDTQGMTTKAMWQVYAAFADQGRDLRRLMNLYEAALADQTTTPACGQAYLYLMGLPADVLKRTGLSGKWLPVPAPATKTSR